MLVINPTPEFPSENSSIVRRSLLRKKNSSVQWQQQKIQNMPADVRHSRLTSAKANKFYINTNSDYNFQQNQYSGSMGRKRNSRSAVGTRYRQKQSQTGLNKTQESSVENDQSQSSILKAKNKFEISRTQSTFKNLGSTQ